MPRECSGDRLRGWVVVCLVGYSVCLILEQIKVKSEFSLKVKSFIRKLHVLVELASFVFFHNLQQKLNRLSEASRQFVYLSLFFSSRFGGLFFERNGCVCVCACGWQWQDDEMEGSWEIKCYSLCVWSRWPGYRSCAYQQHMLLVVMPTSDMYAELWIALLAYDDDGDII